MFDILAAVVPSARPDFNRLRDDQIANYLAKQGHCSVLIKVRLRCYLFCSLYSCGFLLISMGLFFVLCGLCLF